MSSVSMLEQSLAADFIPWPVNDLQQTRRKSVGPKQLMKTTAVWVSPETALGYAYPEQAMNMVSHVPMFDPLPVMTSESMPAVEPPPISVTPAQATPVPPRKSESTTTLSLTDHLRNIRTTLDETALSILSSTVPVLPYPALPSVTSLQPSKLTHRSYIDLSNKSTSDNIFTFSCDPYTPQHLHYHAGQPFPDGTHGFLYYFKSQDTFFKSEMRFKITPSSDPSSFSKGKDLQLPSGEPWCIPLLLASPAIREHLEDDRTLSQQQAKDLDVVIKQIGGRWRKGDQILFNLKDEFRIDLGRYGRGRSKQGVWVIGEGMKCGKVWVGGTGVGMHGELLPFLLGGVWLTAFRYPTGSV
ncbi:hypothetical protein BDQ17DRAFT_412286 [Cyathus striatus]|nr:hypothetical protein BDQ17DRAFT_412286 [Cyathus striatus]